MPYEEVERAAHIRQTLAGGENDFTEFKSTLRWNILKGDRDGVAQDGRSLSE